MLTHLLRNSSVVRLARQVRWSLSNRPAASALSGRVSVQTAPAMAESNTPTVWVVRIENHSRRVWRRVGTDAVTLRARWIDRTGNVFGTHGDTPLPRTLLPGDWADVSVPVNGPGAVGDFALEWSLAADWSEGATPTARSAVPVTFPRSIDIDYHHVYANADLAKNSWWVVGAYHSQEEYAKSAASRRGMLIEHGLTPDSRVLDIGCGTGQMAMALEDYLSDRGAFYGTDIGREGIEFARRTYRRPNFHFAVGEMTRVPFPTSAGPFDLAIFFSVFTHTFVDESVLLLAEARRLLRPGGAVIADVIVSELVERGAGNRGQMWVNRGHFVRLAEALGFTAHEIATFPWADGAVRVMFRFVRGG
jgi:ubiquinone/menaquinone biosynthesis C-methylase UbiE